jgi:phytoene dehydrogenase-like protein
MRSGEITLPGFTHDICSAIHPMALASPFFRSLELGQYGLSWIRSPRVVAHPFDDGSAAVLDRSLDMTCDMLGPDGRAYRALFAHLVDTCDTLLPALLAPLIPPRKPFAMSRFALNALKSASDLARERFRSEHGRALFAGIAAHSILPLEERATASFGLVLGMVGHVCGWPLPRGGSQSLADSLVACLTAAGGSIILNHAVTSANELRDADVVMFDVTPRQLLAMAGDTFPSRYRDHLARFRYGPAAFKIDWALSEAIPWRAPSCREAATVHVGGTLDEIAASERMPARGEHPDRPFVLLTQPSLFDDTRAPDGQHTAWAYCHVPNGSTLDMTRRIEAQIERFAPGFRDIQLSRRIMSPATLEAYNPNYVGGDVVGGANDLLQTLGRPMLKLDPYAIPVRGWYLCSASTPPGGGVHGMCGYHAAQSALRHLRRT